MVNQETPNQNRIWDGDAFVPCAGVPATDRGFRYGMAVFETVALRNGAPEFLAEHLTRLRDACLRCGFPVPGPAIEAIHGLADRIPGSGVLRVYVTAGDGGLDTAVRQARVLVLFEPRATAARSASWRLRLSSRPYDPLWPGLKTAHYWRNIIARDEAKRDGFDEALLFNPHGELVSAATANIFIVRHGRLETPPAASGARSGVVRDWVCSRREVAETIITRETLAEAAELFVTNSWIGVMPVRDLDGRILSSCSAGSELQAQFHTGPPGG